MDPRRVPVATYRLQFNRGLRFPDARALVPYLHALGITDLYASPLLAARPGSPHGYDITDPTRLNLELGGEEEFAALVGELRRHGMGLLLDVVANHMAADAENPWWLDVLRNGRNSPFGNYFDVDWQPPRPGLTDKILIPVLGAPYGRVLENGELLLVLEEDGLWIRYGNGRLPLHCGSQVPILAHWANVLLGALGPDHPASREVGQLFVRAEGKPAEDVFPQLVAGMWSLYCTWPEVRAVITDNLREWNADHDRLDRLLSGQCYRVAFWRVAGQEINYRRFFDVNDLVGVRVEEEQVFEATHGRILELAGTGRVTGLRIDHIDGLHDPCAYLGRLQERLSGGPTAPPFYVVVEKILSGNEELPPDWPVCGTTGYDFLNTVNGLFADPSGVEVLDELYRRVTGCEADFGSVVYEQKRRVMTELFPGDLRRLARQLGRLAEEDRHGRDLTLNEIEQALLEVTACLPVYRTYVRGYAVAPRDRVYLEHALGEALRRRPAIERAVGFLRRVLLLDFPGYLPPGGRRAWLEFVMRWQQFTGSVMAKGFEDTALYLYHRLVSFNEVGGDSGGHGVSVAEFHRRNGARLRRRPHTLNATSTHDTKRSEDVRARINVLTEIPDLWADRLDRWVWQNAPKKRVLDGRPVPDANTELLLYQTLLGAWPLRKEDLPEFRKRLGAYMLKAAREAKVHTSWLEPDTDYERALLDFVNDLLEPGHGNGFLEDFLQFQRFVAYYGALNSLAQVLLKITSPGVPDFYQGTELWDFSLVDPDNRRPVDFGVRAALLGELRRREAKDLGDLVSELLSHWQDGRIKLYLTYRALHHRKKYHRLFARGEYLPLGVEGPFYDHVCAFARRLDRTWTVTAVPRLPARLCRARLGTGPGGLPPTEPPLGRAAWGETSLVLPSEAPECWDNVLTGEALIALPGSRAFGCKALPLANVFRSFPVALLAAGPGSVPGS